MSWRDRDYGDGEYGEPGAIRRHFRAPPPVSLALLLLHAAAFVLLLALQVRTGGAAVRVMALTGSDPHPAAIALHPFATTGVLSLLFVVLALWSLGGRLEQRLGRWRLLGLYITGNAVAGAAYFAVARLQPGLAVVPLDYPVGALAALCAAAWRHLRTDDVLVFGRVTSVAKVYAISAGIVAALALLGGQAGALAWLAAAVVGAGVAPLLDGLEHVLGNRRRVLQPARRRRAVSVARGTAQAEPDIDPILAKISRSGFDSLTRSERNLLEKARQAKLRRG
jgi:membrane associated rhomboid family serine protease